MAEPAGSAHIAKILAPLVLVFGLGEQSQSDQFWRVYRDALGDVPRIALERAATEYAKTGKFFPKPAEILDLAKPHSFALKQAAARAEAATKVRLSAPKPIEDTPEQREAVAKLLADYMEGVKEKLPKRAPHKAVRGPTDSSGVTEAGRALIARRAESGYQ